MGINENNNGTLTRPLIIETNEDLLSFMNDANLVLLNRNLDKRNFCILHIVRVRGGGDGCRNVVLESSILNTPITFPTLEDSKDRAELKANLIELYQDLDGFSYKQIRSLLKEIIENV